MVLTAAKGTILDFLTVVSELGRRAVGHRKKKRRV